MWISSRSSPARSAWALLLVGACSEEPGLSASADGPLPSCPLSILHPRVVKLSTSGSAMMALFSDGTAVCWGENDYGECAHSAGGGFIWPTVSPGIECAIDVNIDGGQGVAIGYDRTVRIFGSSFDTLDPIDPNYQFGVPIEVPGLRPVRSAVNSGEHAFVVLEDGSVLWWGVLWWSFDSPTSQQPTAVSGLPPTRKVTGGLATSCALTEEGEVWCWGATLFGQLGDATTKRRATPARVEGLEGRRMVDLDVEAVTCALQDSGELFCLGENRHGDLGRGYFGDEDGHPAFEVRPAPVIGLPPASAVDVALGVSCALTREAEVYCWGLDTAGWGGESSLRPSYATPMRIPGGTEVAQFAAAPDGICMLKVDGSVWCVGDPIMMGMGIGAPDSIPFERGVAAQVDFSKTWECTASGDSCDLAE